MEVAGQFFTHLFSEVWRVLQLNMPVFNIPIWYVWVGIFIIGLSIKIFRGFLGLDSVSYSSSQSRNYPRKGGKDA